MYKKKSSQEIRTFEANKVDLLDKASGRYVLIVGHNIVKFFDNEQDAINFAYRKYGNIPFLVKKITELETPLHITHCLVAN